VKPVVFTPRARIAIAVCCCVFFSSHTVFAEDADDSGSISWPRTWQDWWQTRSQQAVAAWREQDLERLEKVTQDRAWRGAVAYQRGDYEAAGDAFSTALPAEIENSAIASAAELRDWFNQATTDVQRGDYEQAIARYDAVLEAQAEHPDALRNKAIAERLLELQQQDGEQGQEGESGDESESGENSEPSENQGDEQKGESGDSDQPPDNPEQGDPSDDAADGEPSAENNSDQSDAPTESNSDDSTSDDQKSAEEQQAEIDAAREALLAGSEDEPADDSGNTARVSDESEPMTEREQATEQWLRQIPDDPDGLLRRKLLQNHRSEYPNVLENGRDW